jgi:hypothetical protein
MKNIDSDDEIKIILENLKLKENVLEQLITLNVL